MEPSLLLDDLLSLLLKLKREYIYVLFLVAFELFGTIIFGIILIEDMRGNVFHFPLSFFIAVAGESILSLNETATIRLLLCQ